MKRARLHDLYMTQVRPRLKEDLKLDNIMRVPRIQKIVLNAGLKESVADSKMLQTIEQAFGGISGQLPMRTHARKSIAGFKIREGMPIGVKVTLRGRSMYEFFDKLVNVSLANVRDFQGVTLNFDGRGGYNLGIKDWSIFPELETTSFGDKTHGLNITIQTSTPDDKQAYHLLKALGMPFRKEQAR